MDINARQTDSVQSATALRQKHSLLRSNRRRLPLSPCCLTSKEILEKFQSSNYTHCMRSIVLTQFLLPLRIRIRSRLN